MEEEKKSAIERAREYGIDISLLESSLKLTIEQRIQRLEDWVEFSEKITHPDRDFHPKSQRRNALEELFTTLIQNNVEFVVVGELASSIHCVSHTMSVIELCYARNPENLERLVHALNPLHPTRRGDSQTSLLVLDRRVLESGHDFKLSTRIGEVDLLEVTGGVGSYDTIKANAVEVSAKGLRFLVLDLPGLIASKRFAGRKKDEPVILELEAIQELLKQKK